MTRPLAYPSTAPQGLLCANQNVHITMLLDCSMKISVIITMLLDCSTKISEKNVQVAC